jgi:hypothetical protein
MADNARKEENKFKELQRAEKKAAERVVDLESKLKNVSELPTRFVDFCCRRHEWGHLDINGQIVTPFFRKCPCSAFQNRRLIQDSRRSL